MVEEQGRRPRGIRAHVLAVFAVVALLGILVAVGITGSVQAQAFTDIRTDEWFHAAVEDLVDRGVVSGYPDGSFRPYDPVTRAQFAGMLATALQLTPSETRAFADVDPNSWFAGLLAALCETGIVQGDSNGLFVPNAELERQQAASMVLRALAFVNSGEALNEVPLMMDPAEAEPWLQGFKDRGSISAHHRLSVADAFRTGLVSGFPDSRFYPFIPLTRAQAAGILHQAFYMAVEVRSSPPGYVVAEAGYPSNARGSTGPLVLWMERRLAALSYRPGPVDGVFDAATADAVMAFQKVEGLARTGMADDRAVRTLLRAVAPAARVKAPGHRAEIDLTRQVLLLVDGNAVQGVIPIASGASGTRTPTGTFAIERKLPHWRRSHLGLLYKPAYFYGGYAIHGSHSVPAQPASHGCVRVGVDTMDWLYPLLPIGMRVDIYY